MVEFLDRVVQEGRAASRAGIVSAALEREMRRISAERDLETLNREGAEDDLDAVVDWTNANVRIDD